MVNKPKAKGTRWESDLVSRFMSAGLHARRVDVGGVLNAPDLEVWIDGRELLVPVQAKHRKVLNIHEELKRMLTHDEDAVVIWKRDKLKEGGKKATPVGVPVVAMSIDTFIRFMRRAQSDARTISVLKGDWSG